MIKNIIAAAAIAAPFFATPAAADCRGFGCQVLSTIIPAAQPLGELGDNFIARAKGEQGSQGYPGGPIGAPPNAPGNTAAPPAQMGNMLPASFPAPPVLTPAIPVPTYVCSTMQGNFGPFVGVVQYGQYCTVNTGYAILSGNAIF